MTRSIKFKNAKLSWRPVVNVCFGNGFIARFETVVLRTGGEPSLGLEFTFYEENNKPIENLYMRQKLVPKRIFFHFEERIRLEKEAILQHFEFDDPLSDLYIQVFQADRIKAWHEKMHDKYAAKMLTYVRGDTIPVLKQITDAGMIYDNSLQMWYKLGDIPEIKGVETISLKTYNSERGWAELENKQGKFTLTKLPDLKPLRRGDT